MEYNQDNSGYEADSEPEKVRNLYQSFRQCKRLKVYQYKNMSAGDKVEMKFQQTVNNRFFRLNKAPRANGKAIQLINLLNDVFYKTDNPMLDDMILLDPNDINFPATASFYLNKAINLTGYSARSVIIALTHLLNDNFVSYIDGKDNIQTAF